jgi:hypothetical protein
MAITITRYTEVSTPTGFTATASHGWDMCYNEESGSLVDRTSEFTGGAAAVNSFADVDDYIYLGRVPVYDASTRQDGRIVKIHLELDTPASATIQPTFEYRNSSGNWVSLPIRSDGTAGFTQDGTIYANVNVSTFPSMAGWPPTTTVGDGVNRTYLRIKRGASSLTTPPKIKEIGTGTLEPSTTYYYTMKSLTNCVGYATTSARRESSPTSEVSATTTNTKRCVDLTWDSLGSTSFFPAIWRTMNSGDYKLAGRTNYYGGGDVTVSNAFQQDTLLPAFINAHQFNFRTCVRLNQTKTVDTGYPFGAIYVSTSSTYQDCIRNQYTGTVFFNRRRGNIKVTGGSVDVDSFSIKDIYDECVVQGWDEAIEYRGEGLAGEEEGPYAYRTWEVYDHIEYVSCTWREYNGSINLYGMPYGYTDSAVHFGVKAETTYARGTVVKPERGMHIIFSSGVAQNVVHYFRNAKIYSCRWTQNVMSYVSSADSRTYIASPAFLGTTLEIKDLVVEGQGMLEGTQFSGTEYIDLEGMIIHNPRYGLTFVSPDIRAKNITVYGSVFIQFASYPDGSVITFRDFVLRGGDTAFGRCYLYANTPTRYVTVNFVNLDLIAHGNGQLNSADIGINYTLNEQYEFKLEVVDKDGNPLEDATILLEDKNGNEVFTDTTDSTGAIATKDVTYKRYTAGTLISSTYNNYKSDVVTEYSPFRLVVSKAGYENYEVVLDLNRKTDETVALNKQKPLLIVDGEDTVLNLLPADPTNTAGYVSL